MCSLKPNTIHAMNRPVLLASLSVGLACRVASTRGASITYNIQNYPDVQRGYTISGTITTDGTIGTLAQSDVLAWSYTITLGGSILDQQSDIGAGHGVAARNVFATATELTISPPTGLNLNEFELAGDRHATIFWMRDLPADFYGANGPAFEQFFSASTSIPPGLLLPSSTWIIAQTIPEPGSLTLALLGLPCLAATVLWTGRSSRAGRDPSSSPIAHS
jgi:hypothetical protein